MSTSSGGQFTMDEECDDDDLRRPPELQPNANTNTSISAKHTQPTSLGTHTFQTAATVHNGSNAAKQIQPHLYTNTSFALQNRVNAGASSSNGASKRIRLYTRNSTGPYSVIIREISIKMTPIRFASYINQTYKSVKAIKRSPGKLSVALNDLSEANALVKDNFFKDFEIYIPADRVEVEGAFDYEELSDLNDMNVLITNGSGAFNNNSLVPVGIVHAERISKVNPEYPLTQRYYTNTVKVIFEGQILPNFIQIEGLRIRVRPFHKKPMFCDNCQKFKHTAKYCRSAPKCARCEGNHVTTKCNSIIADNSVCTFCLLSPMHDKKECSFFKEAEEGFNAMQAARRKSRFKYALSTVNRNSQHAEQNSVPAINDNSEFPTLNNRFNELAQDEQHDETDPPTSETPKPKNPYSKVLKAAVNKEQFSRKATKRPRSTLPKSAASSAQGSSQPTNVSRSVSQTRCTNNSTIQALKTAILALARQANISESFMCIIEVVIEPLLQAILPQHPALSGQSGQSVLNSRP